MPLPRPREDVPRSEVHQAVEFMLMNAEVGDIHCVLQQDGTYRVVPSPRSGLEQNDN